VTCIQNISRFSLEPGFLKIGATERLAIGGVRVWHLRIVKSLKCIDFVIRKCIRISL